MRTDVPENFEDVTVAYVEAQLDLESEFKIYRGRWRWCLAVGNIALLISLYYLAGPRPLLTELTFIVNLNVTVAFSIPVADSLATRYFRTNSGVQRIPFGNLRGLMPRRDVMASLNVSERRIASGLSVLLSRRIRDAEWLALLRIYAPLTAVGFSLILLPFLWLILQVQTVNPSSVFLVAVLTEAVVLLPLIFVGDAIRWRRASSFIQEESEMELRFRSE